MRKVYSSLGGDVTSTVQSFLAANRTLYMCDLMMMSSWTWWGAPNGNPAVMNFYFSFGDFPVQVANVQTGPNTVSPITIWGTTRPATFLPMPINRDKLEYGIGFTANNCDVTWYCSNSLVPIPLQQSQGPPGSPSPFNPLSIGVSPGGKLRVDWLGGLTIPETISGTLADGFGIASPAPLILSGAIMGAFADANGRLLQLEGFPRVTNPPGTLAPPHQAFLIGNSATLQVPPRAANLLIWTATGNTLDQVGMHTIGVWGDGIQPNAHYPTWQQGFSAGMFDECPVYLYRAFFNGDPKQGGTLLGTTLMFRGFVREAETAQDHVKLSLSSLLDLFQEVQVPTQLIQPGNRTTPYVPSGVSCTVGGLDLVNSTQSTLRFSTSSPTVADHALRDAYLITGAASSWTPANAQPQPSFLRIRDNATISGTLFVYLYEPTVIPLENLGQFWGGGGFSGSWIPFSADLAVLLQKPLSNTYGAPGFPSVPVPEIGI